MISVQTASASLPGWDISIHHEEDASGGNVSIDTFEFPDRSRLFLLTLFASRGLTAASSAAHWRGAVGSMALLVSDPGEILAGAEAIVRDQGRSTLALKFSATSSQIHSASVSADPISCFRLARGGVEHDPFASGAVVSCGDGEAFAVLAGQEAGRNLVEEILLARAGLPAEPSLDAVGHFRDLLEKAGMRCHRDAPSLTVLWARRRSPQG